MFREAKVMESMWVPVPDWQCGFAGCTHRPQSQPCEWATSREPPQAFGPKGPSKAAELRSKAAGSETQLEQRFGGTEVPAVQIHCLLSVCQPWRGTLFIRKYLPVLTLCHVLGAWEMSVNEPDKGPCLLGLTLQQRDADNEETQ